MAQDGKEFEIWIVDKFGRVPNEKDGKDGGIDGHTQYGTPIQVKKWKKTVDLDTLDAFLTAIKKGIQEKKFAEGEHHVAVQAVDKKGLSGTEKVKIDVKRKKERS